jgi:3-methyl-2-oxobutanoate hydroxymethyltransferase
MLGLYGDLKPRFVKQYADVGASITGAVQDYCREVRGGEFPAREHAFR